MEQLHNTPSSAPVQPSTASQQDPVGADSQQTVTNPACDITLLGNVYSTEPIHMGMHEIVELATSPEVKDRTLRIRLLNSKANDMTLSVVQRLADKNKADSEKGKLPCVQPNVHSEGGKKRPNIVRFLPHIAIDVDDITEAKALECMSSIATSPYFEFAAPSCRRHGIHAFLRIDCEEWLNAHWDGVHTEAYDYVWEQARAYVEQLIGVPVDQKCKTPEHVFAVNYDEAIYFNLNAEALHIDLSGFVTKQRKGKATSTVKCKGKQHHAALADVCQSILNKLADDGCDFIDGNRNFYVARFCFLANDYGVDRDELTEYCLASFVEGGFTEQEVLSVIDSTYHKTESHGSRKPAGKARYINMEELERYIADYGEFRYNEVTLEYEIRPKGTTEFRTCADEDENEIYRQILSDGKLTTVNQLRTIIRSHLTPHYHPFRDYRDHLPKCELLPDGTCRIEGRTEARDYIAELAARVHVKSDPAEFCYYFRKWYVAWIRSLVQEDFVNHTVLGFFGVQGIYKTTFFQKLLPPQFQKKYFYLKTNSNRMDKDDRLKMAFCALICLEEMDTMTAQELNQLKAHITMNSIDERPAYGRNVQHLSRLCSFAMTGNEPQFLTDTTGNRRFLPFLVSAIDNPHEGFDYEALFAQGFALAASDFVCYIEHDDMAKLEAHNAKFMDTILEYDLVDKYIGLPGDTGAVVDSLGGIKTYLEQYTRERLSTRKIGKRLREKGIMPHRTSTNNMYRVRYLTGEEVNSKQKTEALAPDMPF